VTLVALIAAGLVWSFVFFLRQNSKDLESLEETDRIRAKGRRTVTKGDDRAGIDPRQVESIRRQAELTASPAQRPVGASVRYGPTSR
jgi:hypothetical protein